MHDTLNFAGALLQIAGVVVAGIGLALTWREFKPADARFTDAPAWRARAIAHSVTDPVRRRIDRVLARHRHVALAAADTVRIADDVRVRVQFGPLPPEPAAAIANLDERTRRLMDMSSDASGRLSDEVSRATGAERALREVLDEAAARLDERGQRAAIGGVYWEATGLFLIAVGLGLQVIAGLWQTAT